MAPIISMGRLRMGESASQGFTLPSLRAFRGRVNVAIPTAGILLPEAKDPTTTPVTYSVANLPAGLSFAPATRIISGTPSTAHATRAVVYTATDSATPAETVTKSFSFPIVSSTAELDWQDWDSSGYITSTKGLLYWGLFTSGTDVLTSGNQVVFAIPPRSTMPVGSLLSTPLDKHEIAGSAPITRLYARSGGTGWQVSDDSPLNLGTDVWTANLSTHSFFWQTVDGVGSWRFNQGSWSKGSSWLTAQGFPNATRDLIRAMDNNVRFIFAIAEN